MSSDLYDHIGNREPESSTFNSFLRYLSRPGYAVRDLLGGNVQGAGRQLVDTVTDTVDAFLPGDLIPELSREQDYTEVSDLIGGMDDGWGKTAVDIIGGVATDPLTYLTFGAAPAAGAAAKGLKVADKLDDVARTGAQVAEVGSHLSKAGRAAQKANPGLVDDLVAGAGGQTDDILKLLETGSEHADLFNQGGMRMRVPFTDIGTDVIGAGKNLDPLTNVGSLLSKVPGASTTGHTLGKMLGWNEASAAGEDVLARAAATDRGTAKAGNALLEQKLSGFSEPARQALVKAMHGVDEANGGWVPLKDSVPLKSFENFDEQLARLNERLGQVGQHLDPGELARLQDAGADLITHNMNDWKTGIEKGIFSQADDVLEGTTPSLYMQRLMSKVDDVEEAGFSGGNASASKGRVFNSPEELAEGLNRGDFTMDMDLAKSVANRSKSQGQMLAQAQVGRELLGDTYNIVDDTGRASLNNAIETVSEIDPNFADGLKRLTQGMEPRNGFMNFLNTTNRAFKPFAVYGAILPKIGSIVRNKIGQAWQAASTDATRSGAIAQLKSAIPDLIDGASEAYLGIPQSAMGRSRAFIEDAFQKSNGQFDDVVRILNETNPDLALAAQHGILDGFVKSEDLVKALNKIDNPTGWEKAWSKAFDGPGVWFNAVESNGRLGMFLHLRSQGVNASNAAKAVQDAFLDYSVTGAANRGLRDVIPFASFLTGTVKQQSKLVSQNPGVGSLMNQLFGQKDEGPIYPWLSEQAHMRMPWNDEEDNPVYAAGLGLPIEALNSIPNIMGDKDDIGRELERSLVGSSHPLIKSVYSMISGHDPYFRSDYGSYAKDPLTHQNSEFGKAYNVVAGTGMIQPVDSLLRTIGKFTDDRKTLPAALLDSMTGIKLQSVDENRALKQLLREHLEDNADVGTFSGFYSDDDELKELIKQFRKL